MTAKPYKWILIACSLLSATAVAMTRVDPKPPAPTESMPLSEPEGFEARNADVATIDGIIAATYDVISGPAGAKRDWDRMRSLFRPDVARLISIGMTTKGQVRLRSSTLEEYIANASGFFAETAFYERELSRKQEQFGHIAHVFSTYEAVHEPEGEPFDRGINSFQLMWDNNRWWVITIYWESESKQNPIPAKYLNRE